MPALDQNFLKFEEDTFSIEWTVVDATTTLGSSNYWAWWGISDTNSADYTSDIAVEKTSNPSGITSVTSTSPTDCSSAGATNVLAAGSSPWITVGASTVYLNVTYEQLSDAGLTANGDYYHELVLIPRSSNNIYPCRSVVSATGILSISQSMFTQYSYR